MLQHFDFTGVQGRDSCTHTTEHVTLMSDRMPRYRDQDKLQAPSFVQLLARSDMTRWASSANSLVAGAKPLRQAPPPSFRMSAWPTETRTSRYGTRNTARPRVHTQPHLHAHAHTTQHNTHTHTHTHTHTVERFSDGLSAQAVATAYKRSFQEGVIFAKYLAA